MKALVTGAAGFIASHLTDALVEQGATVIGLDSLDPGVHRGLPAYLNPGAEYCFADLRGWEPDSRFEDVEVVFHLAALGGVSRAAREPANIITANCGGTARLVQFARSWEKLRHCILASSFSVYGMNYEYLCPDCGARTNGARNPADLEAGRYEVLCPRCRKPAQVQPITESAAPGPLETYGASKYMQELCFRGFPNGRVSILRLSSVYGTRLRLDDGEATIIARLAGWIRAGVPPQLFEDGQQTRDWVHVADVVDAALALASGKEAATVVNVCSGCPATLQEAVRYIAAAMDLHPEPQIVGGYRPGDMRHCLGDASGLQRLIGRKPLELAEGARLAFVLEGGHSAHVWDPSHVGA